jgi:hypothetical protein
MIRARAEGQRICFWGEQAFRPAEKKNEKEKGLQPLKQSLTSDY